MKRSDRYAWVDVAKGICIVAVVCLYARSAIAHAFGAAGWLEAWTAFARPFRMPDFFLLSGLFLGAVIDRPWRSYLDTKVVHYVYFLVLWVGLVYAYEAAFMPDFPGRGEGPFLAMKRYVYYLYHPDHMLWFIQVLPMYFVVTRLVKAVPQWLVFAVAAALMLWRVETGVAALDNFCQYYVFFLAGYMGASWIFRFADDVRQRPVLAWLGFLAWIVVNQSAVSLGWTASSFGAFVVGFIGITAVITLSCLVAKVHGLGWLRFLGANSIVVYLGFYIPLQVFIGLYQRSGWAWNIHVLATLLVVASTATPVLLFLGVRHTRARFLFERPAWARVQPPKVVQTVACRAQ